jgi:hypothetical protein
MADLNHLAGCAQVRFRRRHDPGVAHFRLLVRQRRHLGTLRSDGHRGAALPILVAGKHGRKTKTRRFIFKMGFFHYYFKKAFVD